MRLLLVEDEKRLAQALCEILRQEKYDVDHFVDGLEGLLALETGIYDLAVLDVMLPGKNGFEIVADARKSGIKTPMILTVINSGKEISAEQQKYLFERFYRADTARSGEGYHYGLGLAIAKAIVTAHKGTIQVLCADGKVEFVVKLPSIKHKS